MFSAPPPPRPPSREVCAPASSQPGLKGVVSACSAAVSVPRCFCGPLQGSRPSVSRECPLPHVPLPHPDPPPLVGDHLLISSFALTSPPASFFLLYFSSWSPHCCVTHSTARFQREEVWPALNAALSRGEKEGLPPRFPLAPPAPAFRSFTFTSGGVWGWFLLNYPPKEK